MQYLSAIKHVGVLQIVVALAVAFPCYGEGRSAKPPIRVSGSYMVGSMMRGSLSDSWLGKRPLMGGEVSIEFMPTGKWACLQDWNNASVGVALDYINLSNRDVAGDAFAPYFFMKIPLVRRPHFILGVRPGIGVSFVTKTYYNTVPAEQKGESGSIRYSGVNGAIGSHTNAYFAEALYMEFPIRRGWSVYASYGWYHISNGSIRQPNSGYNMFNGMIGVVYQPYEDKYIMPKATVPRHVYDGKRWEVELSVSGGVRQAYYVDNRYFGAGSISLSAYWRAYSLFRLGGGIDVFYDGYYRSICDEFAGADKSTPITYYEKTYLPKGAPANCWRIGISLQPEFVVGNLSIGFHCGVYLYDNIKNIEPYSEAKMRTEAGRPLRRGIFYAYDIGNAGVTQDGWLYTRIMLKYHCTKHFFVQAGMKAHLTKVEFIDAGVGFSL